MIVLLLLGAAVLAGCDTPAVIKHPCTGKDADAWFVSQTDSVVLMRLEDRRLVRVAETTVPFGGWTCGAESAAP